MAYVNNKTSTKEALKRIKSLIKGGWVKYGWRENWHKVDRAFEPVTNADGNCYCIIGALNQVVGFYDKEMADAMGRRETIESRVYNRIFGALQKACPKDCPDPMTFNDRSLTTKKDVLDLIDRAIEAA